MKELILELLNHPRHRIYQFWSNQTNPENRSIHQNHHISKQLRQIVLLDKADGIIDLFHLLYPKNNLEMANLVYLKIKKRSVSLKFCVNNSHIPRTGTQVKVFESDIPSHTNQNIGIFQQKNHNIEIILPADLEKQPKAVSIVV